MKYVVMTYRIGNDFFYNEASKSFQKSLGNFSSKFCIKNVGEIFNPKQFNIRFTSQPIFNPDSKETFVEKFYICSPTYHSYCFKLYFWHIDKTHEIKLLDEVKESEIYFRIEPSTETTYTLEALKNTILRYDKARGVTILEGYKFLVQIKNLDVDLKLKIKFIEPVTLDLRDKLTLFLGNSISNFNDNAKKNDSGIVHSYSFVSKKNEYLSFNIDLGSSSKEGIEAILNDLNESDFEIVKVELDC